MFHKVSERDERPDPYLNPTYIGFLTPNIAGNCFGFRGNWRVREREAEMSDARNPLYEIALQRETSAG